MTNSKKSKEKIIGIVASAFFLSFAIIATAEIQSQLAFAQGERRKFDDEYVIFIHVFASAKCKRDTSQCENILRAIILNPRQA